MQKMDWNSKLPKLLAGEKLKEAMIDVPEYSDAIREADAATRLMALSDIYKIYYPSRMSMEIYTHLHLALLMSLKKKNTMLAVKQQKENSLGMITKEYRGIIGGSDSSSIIGVSGVGKSSAIARSIELVTDNRLIEIDEPYTKIVPILQVQCPFDSSPKGMLLEILRVTDEYLGSSYYRSGTRNGTTTDTLIGLVSQVCLNHIGVLIIDEIQNVVKNRNGTLLIGVLMQLINCSGVSIMVVGCPELSGVGNEDNPLESVFSKMTRSYNYLGDICSVNIGMRTGADKLSESYIQKYSIDLPKNTGIYVLTSEEVKQLELSDFEKTFLVPWYKNSDISQYTCKQKNDLWLIDLSFPKQKNIDFDMIPSIKEHIYQFKPVLENRRSNDNGLQAVLKNGYWWAFTMRQIDFAAPKIVAPQRSKANTFGYNEIPWYASMDVYFITNKPECDVDLKYILGLLNSKLFYVWLYNKGKRKGESLELYQKPLSEVPIYIASDDVQSKIKILVDEILDDSSKKKHCMKEIDDIVYKMYNLTEEEIKIIESQMEG